MYGGIQANRMRLSRLQDHCVPVDGRMVRRMETEYTEQSDKQQGCDTTHRLAAS